MSCSVDDVIHIVAAAEAMLGGGVYPRGIPARRCPGCTTEIVSPTIFENGVKSFISDVQSISFCKLRLALCSVCG